MYGFMLIYANLPPDLQGAPTTVALSRLALGLQSLEMCALYTDPSTLEGAAAQHLRLLWTNVTQAVGGRDTAR